jgi:regulator of sirC expression with transglutaminase-like and TPR domain
VLRAPFADSPEFRRLLDRGEADIARVALEIARDAYPEVDPDAGLARIDALAERVRGRCAPVEGYRHVIGQVNWVLFVEETFRGNTEDYYDPRNSYLNEVLDRKAGIPISLSAVYARVAGRLGLDVGWLDLPYHVMLRVGLGGSTVIVDPFHDGAVLDREGCRATLARLSGRDVTLSESSFTPCPPSAVVARMLRNLKAIYLRGHDYPSALPVQRRLAAVRPGDPEEQRDLGVLYLHVDRPAEAVAPLEHYLDSQPTPPDADEVRALLGAARREAAQRN